MYNINREDIIEEAYMKCMTEMYAKAQPSANFSELLDGVKNGTIVTETKEIIKDKMEAVYGKGADAGADI